MPGQADGTAVDGACLGSSASCCLFWQTDILLAPVAGALAGFVQQVALFIYFQLHWLCEGGVSLSSLDLCFSISPGQAGLAQMGRPHWDIGQFCLGGLPPLHLNTVSALFFFGPV